MLSFTYLEDIELTWCDGNAQNQTRTPPQRPKGWSTGPANWNRQHTLLSTAQPSCLNSLLAPLSNQWLMINLPVCTTDT